MHRFSKAEFFLLVNNLANYAHIFFVSELIRAELETMEKQNGQGSKEGDREEGSEEGSRQESRRQEEALNRPGSDPGRAPGSPLLPNFQPAPSGVTRPEISMFSGLVMSDRRRQPDGCIRSSEFCAAIRWYQGDRF